MFAFQYRAVWYTVPQISRKLTTNFSPKKSGLLLQYNLVLSTELISELATVKRFDSDADSEFDEGLALETSAFESLYGG